MLFRRGGSLFCLKQANDPDGLIVRREAGLLARRCQVILAQRPELLTRFLWCLCGVFRLLRWLLFSGWCWGWFLG